MPSLVIRADASTAIGTGHVMRCLALAQHWQQARGPVVFASTEMPDSLAERILAEGMQVESLDAGRGSGNDAAETVGRARAHGAAWVVADGYAFGYEYQCALRDAGLHVLLFDDHGHAGNYCADVVLNQNLHGARSSYAQREPYTQLLIGTKYSLLRKEFWPWRDWRRETLEIARRILVTLGGSDESNVTLQVLYALQATGVPGLEIVAVVGSANPHYESLCAVAERVETPFRVARNVADMAAQMAWAELAVAAGGGTSWELAFMGLPSIVVPLSPGEEEVAACLAEHGVCDSLPCRGEIDREQLASTLRAMIRDPRRRGEIASAGRRLVDGRGGERILSAMERVA